MAMAGNHAVKGTYHAWEMFDDWLDNYREHDKRDYGIIMEANKPGPYASNLPRLKPNADYDYIEESTISGFIDSRNATAGLGASPLKVFRNGGVGIEGLVGPALGLYFKANAIFGKSQESTQSVHQPIVISTLKPVSAYLPDPGPPSPNSGFISAGGTEIHGDSLIVRGTHYKNYSTVDTFQNSSWRWDLFLK